MLISSKATDTIYQAVLQILQQQGFEENKPLIQCVLLGEGHFLGYRFQGISVQIDWLAQNNSLIIKDNQGHILSQKQLLIQKATQDDLPDENDLTLSAA